MFRDVGSYWSWYGSNLRKIVYNPIKWWGPEFVMVVFSGLNEILWPSCFYIGSYIILFHDLSQPQCLSDTMFWLLAYVTFTLQQVCFGFVLLFAKPAMWWYRLFLLPPSLSLLCQWRDCRQFPRRYASVSSGALVTLNYIFCHSELKIWLSSLELKRGKEGI